MFKKECVLFIINFILGLFINWNTTFFKAILSLTTFAIKSHHSPFCLQQSTDICPTRATLAADNYSDCLLALNQQKWKQLLTTIILHFFNFYYELSLFKFGFSCMNWFIEIKFVKLIYLYLYIGIYRFILSNSYVEEYCILYITLHFFQSYLKLSIKIDTRLYFILLMI